MLFVLLAALAASLAAVIVYSALRSREAELQKAIAGTIEIGVAARDLPLGTRLEPGMIKMVRWARDSLPIGAVTDPQSVMNSIVRDAFVENEPIVTSKLFSGEKAAGVMPLLVPPGMRAMSIAVDEVSGVAGFILPHARVDVLASVWPKAEQAYSRVVLQDIEVLAVAQQLEVKKDEPQVVKVVTLAVTHADGERLALAASQGMLRLALRNYSDDKIVLTSGSDTNSVFGRFTAGGPLPVAASQAPLESGVSAPGAPGSQVRPRPTEVEIIRDGKRRELVSFIRGARVKASEGRTAPGLAPLLPGASSAEATVPILEPPPITPQEPALAPAENNQGWSGRTDTPGMP
jgi:pilus assembly protein CpaB